MEKIEKKALVLAPRYCISLFESGERHTCGRTGKLVTIDDCRKCTLVSDDEKRLIEFEDVGPREG